MSRIASKYDLKDDKGRIAYAGEIAETLCKLNDPVEREVYTTRAAEAASLPAEAMRMEVQRAAKRGAGQGTEGAGASGDESVGAQPADRSIRYQNVRSALAEEGVIRLLMQDESLFPPEMPVQPEEFSSPLLGRIYGELWQRRGHAGMAVAGRGADAGGDEPPDGAAAKTGIRSQRAAGAGGLHPHHSGRTQQAHRRHGSAGGGDGDV